MASIRMLSFVFMAVLSAHASPRFLLKRSEHSFPFYSKSDWRGLPTEGGRPLNTPVSHVVIHHTYIPAACYSFEACAASMRSMQTYHNSLNWGDIGYHFAVGGEGSVFEGRGWTAVGAHATNWNSRSIGICMIGDFVGKLPTARALQSLRQLIAAGVQRGFISPQYRLIGHRQVSATECPGRTLFNEISTWPHFSRV